MAEEKKNGAAYLARAAIYTQQSRWSDAVGDLTAAIALKYDLSKSHKARASCYAALKKFDLARQDLSLVHSDK
jgi:tetratricopeptide (TPR) repeat protein